jgi:L,D-transpeptidase catalytic domain
MGIFMSFDRFQYYARFVAPVFGFVLFGALAVHPAVSQTAVVFAPGTGSPAANPMSPRIRYANAQYHRLACTVFPEKAAALRVGYGGGSIIPHKLSRTVLDEALASWQRFHCTSGFGAMGRDGPATIIVVDYARHSSVPRLYVIDLAAGSGLDAPMLVAHGIGSDRNDDGFADTFSNTPDSLASSLGAARGGEIYNGQNGRSLRLDGLEASNNAMRYRDIVVHSYAPERRRYFSASLVAARGGRPGASEGCFVVEPDQRDRVLAILTDGGFLYAGFSGVLPQPVVRPAITATPGQGPVVFARGTGATPPVALAPVLPSAVSEIPGGTPGSPPTAPISPAPATPPQ